MKNITKSVLTVCVGLTAIISAGIANATTFNFSEGNLGLAGGGSYDSISHSSLDGIGLTITAFTITNDGNGNITSPISQVTDSFAGILSPSLLNGVYLSSSTSGNLGVRSDIENDDGSNLDGGSSASDLDEGLLFTFDRLVSLDYINFDSFSGGDDFNLTVDGVNTSILVDFNATDTSSSSLVSEVFDINGVLQVDEFNFNNIVGTSFLFWADGDSDSFRIDSLEVSTVPVPAAAWLFGSAILGLVGFSRRKRI